MRIQNLLTLLKTVDDMYQYLSDKDIDIDENGYPIFRKEMFLCEWPDMVVPYAHRNNWRVIDKKKTVICPFDRDHRLYVRLYKLLSEINEYKKYMGVIELDLTVASDMDEEWQKALTLINQLYLAILAVNGIKIVLNTRSGGLNTEVIFKNIPHDIMVASGFLGCDKSESLYDYGYMKKIIGILPSKIIIYGKHDKIVESQLDTLGIDYKVYADFHRLCKEVRNGR